MIDLTQDTGDGGLTCAWIAGEYAVERKGSRLEPFLLTQLHHPGEIRQSVDFFLDTNQTNQGIKLLHGRKFVQLTEVRMRL